MIKNIKIWLIALRPFAFTASLMPVLIGTFLSIYYNYNFDIFLFILTLLGVLSFHSAANLLNDYYDFKRGLDNQIYPSSGALVRGVLKPSDIYKASLIFIFLGITCGIYLFLLRGLPILLMGLAGTFISLFYTRKTFCFKYNGGLGDLAIFISFGILPLCGSFYVQSLTFNLTSFLFGISSGIQSVGILHANNWHDMENDKKYGCKTFAGILGMKLSQKYYKFLILSPFFLTLLICLSGFITNILKPPYFILIVFITFTFALKIANEDYINNKEKFSKLDMTTSKLHLQFNILTLSGILLSILK